MNGYRLQSPPATRLSLMENRNKGWVNYTEIRGEIQAFLVNNL